MALTELIKQLNSFIAKQMQRPQPQEAGATPPKLGQVYDAQRNRWTKPETAVKPKLTVGKRHTGIRGAPG